MNKLKSTLLAGIFMVSGGAMAENLQLSCKTTNGIVQINTSPYSTSLTFADNYHVQKALDLQFETVYLATEHSDEWLTFNREVTIGTSITNLYGEINRNNGELTLDSSFKSMKYTGYNYSSIKTEKSQIDGKCSVSNPKRLF